MLLWKAAAAAPVPHEVRGGLLSPTQVVLSFDDGPNDETSPVLLDVLRRHDVQALFFHVGVNIRKRSLMRRFMREGHCVGVHTMRHAHLTRMPIEGAKREIDESVQTFRNVTGERPYFFRPPYGESSDAISRFVEERGMVSFLWDIDSSDWRVHDNLSTSIGSRLHRKGTHGILLLHEYAWTTEQAEGIVQSVRSHGYQIVHPVELLSHDQVSRLRAEACPSDVQEWCKYAPRREKVEL